VNAPDSTSALKLPALEPTRESAPAQATPLRPVLPSVVLPRLQPRGSNQDGLRQYNERVVLQAVRLHGPLSSAEIARITNLTAQTVSLITKRLLDDDLLLRGEPQRGRVGQPSVPLSLNPDGAFAIGIKVGRRSMDVLLVDFTGHVRHRSTMTYVHAEPAALLAAIDERLKHALRRIQAPHRSRMQGVGIAAPLSMGGWQQLLGLPDAVAQQWRSFDIAAQVARRVDTPVALVKDTAAACVAELVAGQGRSVKSFLYVFVDTFIGGGLVIDSHLHAGVTGNAGALGSMPLGMVSMPAPAMAPPQNIHAAPPQNINAPPPQMLSVASLLALEQAYAQAGLDVTAVMDARAWQAPWAAVTQSWLTRAADAMAHGVHSAACLLDMEGVIIDGSFDRTMLARVIDAVQAAMARYNWEGVRQPPVTAGTIGSDARAVGGAILPLYANFAPDPDVFLKAQA
jgi:predicted NBD/HSP70 family sugar kinase